MGEYIGSTNTPPHYFVPGTVYMVTASTFRHANIFDGDAKLRNLTDNLLQIANRYCWRLEAWSIFPNHYHFVAMSPDDPLTLTQFIRTLHSITAKHVNKLDGTAARRVWHNYWDTCITGEEAYLARLNYVHMNPVKHGLVEKPENYPYCSYLWFIETNPTWLCKRVLDQPMDLLELEDEH